MPSERLVAHGHEHVRATHGSTLEVTSDDWLTPAGDCIVGIAADRAPASFEETFVEAARHADTRITLTLEAGACRQVVRGHGDPDLTCDSDRCLIVRTSRHVDDRTVMIGADTAAADLDREIVATLQAGSELGVTVTAERGGIDGG